MQNNKSIETIYLRMNFLSPNFCSLLSAFIIQNNFYKKLKVENQKLKGLNEKIINECYFFDNLNELREPIKNLDV